MTTPQIIAGRYTIGDSLGLGGMSEVFRGRDTVLGRDVAVKIMRPDLAREKNFYQRFRREAQNSASLNHPSIVAIYDTGEDHTPDGDLPYIVMELVEGDNLRDIVRMDGPMDPQRALGVIADLCGALDFSHRKGIIHRDVKPANIMITRDGAVKVMDFGIARAVSESTSTLTQTSAVLGTAQYLSPEQARGESVDARSDIYSAGCVLYEMVAGAPPFTGESPVAVAYQHVREDPRPPSAVNPEVDRYIDAVAMQAMAKNPENRYASAGDMRTDLLEVLSGRRPSAPLVLSDNDLDEHHRPETTPEFAGAGYSSVHSGWGRGAADSPTEAHRLPAVAAASGPGQDSALDSDRRARNRRPSPLIIAIAVLLVLGSIAAVGVMVANRTGGFGIDQAEVTIPEVAQRPIDEVTKQLTDLGLKVLPEEHPDPQIPAGVVVSSDPIAGKRLAKGSEITVVVSSGKPIVSVPNVMGLSPADARKTLQDAGLVVAPQNVTKPSTAEDKDKVLSTSPGPGTQIPSDRPVTLTVGSGPEEISVPNVVGQNVSSARSALEEAGFRVDTVQVDGSQPSGQVLSQSTPAGQPQLKGATITVQVSAGNRFQMPNLVNSTVPAALEALRRAGWKGQEDQLVELPQNDPDLTRVGRIFSQQPPVGEAGINDQVVVRVIRFGLVPGPG